MAGPQPVDTHLDRADSFTGRRVCDRERRAVLARGETVLDVEPGVRLGVGLRDEGEPALDLGVLAGGGNRRRVFDAPAPEDDSLGSHFHGAMGPRKRPPCGGLFQETNSAATYSPGRLPSEYHRR